MLSLVVVVILSCSITSIKGVVSWGCTSNTECDQTSSPPQFCDVRTGYCTNCNVGIYDENIGQGDQTDVPSCVFQGCGGYNDQVAWDSATIEQKNLACPGYSDRETICASAFGNGYGDLGDSYDIGCDCMYYDPVTGESTYTALQLCNRCPDDKVYDRYYNTGCVTCTIYDLSLCDTDSNPDDGMNELTGGYWQCDTTITDEPVCYDGCSSGCPDQQCTGYECVDCLYNTDCDSDQICNSVKQCEDITVTCANEQIPNELGECVDCIDYTDCGDDTNNPGYDTDGLKYYCDASTSTCIKHCDICATYTWAPFCSNIDGESCVECNIDDDCDTTNGETCENQQDYTYCSTPVDPCDYCGDWDGTVCNTAGDACVECNQATDCGINGISGTGGTYTCNTDGLEPKCVDPCAYCGYDDNAGLPRCNVDGTTCVECLEDVDCGFDGFNVVTGGQYYCDVDNGKVCVDPCAACEDENKACDGTQCAVCSIDDTSKCGVDGIASTGGIYTCDVPTDGSSPSCVDPCGDCNDGIANFQVCAYGDTCVDCTEFDTTACTQVTGNNPIGEWQCNSISNTCTDPCADCASNEATSISGYETCKTDGSGCVACNEAAECSAFCVDNLCTDIDPCTECGEVGAYEQLPVCKEITYDGCVECNSDYTDMCTTIKFGVEPTGVWYCSENNECIDSCADCAVNEICLEDKSGCAECEGTNVVACGDGSGFDPDTGGEYTCGDYNECIDSCADCDNERELCKSDGSGCIKCTDDDVSMCGWSGVSLTTGGKYICDTAECLDQCGSCDDDNKVCNVDGNGCVYCTDVNTLKCDDGYVCSDDGMCVQCKTEDDCDGERMLCENNECTQVECKVSDDCSTNTDRNRCNDNVCVECTTTTVTEDCGVDMTCENNQCEDVTVDTPAPVTAAPVTSAPVTSAPVTATPTPAPLDTNQSNKSNPKLSTLISIGFVATLLSMM